MKLYRHFNAEGRLLYIGISANPFKRFAEHLQHGAWADAVRTITIEPIKTMFDGSKTGAVDMTAAFAAEYAAIQRERPLYNIYGMGLRRRKTGYAENETCISAAPKAKQLGKVKND